MKININLTLSAPKGITAAAIPFFNSADLYMSIHSLHVIDACPVAWVCASVCVLFVYTVHVYYMYVYSTCMHVCVYLDMCQCVCPCLYILCVYTCIYMHVHGCMHVCMHVCVFAYMCTSIHAYPVWGINLREYIGRTPPQYTNN